MTTTISINKADYEWFHVRLNTPAQNLCWQLQQVFYRLDGLPVTQPTAWKHSTAKQFQGWLLCRQYTGNHIVLLQFSVTWQTAVQTQTSIHSNNYCSTSPRKHFEAAADTAYTGGLALVLAMESQHRGSMSMSAVVDEERMTPGWQQCFALPWHQWLDEYQMHKKPAPLISKILFKYKCRKTSEGNQLTQVYLWNSC